MPRLAMLGLVFLVGLAPLLAADGGIAKPKRDKPHRDKPPIEIETSLLPAAVAAQGGRGGRVSVKNRYIVVLKDGVANPLRVAERLAGDGGVVPTHVYRHVFNGFAAEIAPGRLAAVKRDPNVVSVTRDRIFHIAAQTVPTGVDRIDADLNPVAAIDGVDTRVDVDVAILDTGIDRSDFPNKHPDLNVYVVGYCLNVPGSDGSDQHGHGTHVAGIVGALDNGVGVVGVAPGARLWILDIADANGAATSASFICGMDALTAWAPGNGHPHGDVEVGNLSYAASDPAPGSTCTSGDPVHAAVCSAVDAGVTVVAAAGNSAADANGFAPAAYDEVITVAGLADSDGKPGGRGPATSAGADDAFYTSSNFGGDIDLAAPGVDILSTVPPTGHPCCSDPSRYKSVSGTSMAAPHVAGAAALYIAEHGQVGPDAVKAGLLAQRERYDIPGDPDGMEEGIVHAGIDLEPPEVAIVAPKGGTVRKAPVIKLTATDSGSGVKSVSVRVCKGTSCTFAAGKPLGSDATAPYAVKWKWGKKLPKNGAYTLVARATDKAGNTKLSDPVTIRIKRK